MYQKLKKYYKSDEPDDSGMSIGELENMAEEIRIILVGNKGLTIPEYIKRASEISLFELGHRRIYGVKNEPKMEVFFPSEVWKILKERCDQAKICKLTQEDEEFISKNRGRGYKWIADKIYMDKNEVSKKARKLGIEVTKRVINHFTPEEDEFIKQNSDKDSCWISQKLKRNSKRIRERAKYLGIKLPISFHMGKFKYFTTTEDDFIRENFSKGARWIAERLKRKIESVISRSRYINVKLTQIYHHHYYTKEDDEFIKQNAHKGSKWLALKFGVTPNAIQKHARTKLLISFVYYDNEN